MRKLFQPREDPAVLKRHRLAIERVRRLNRQTVELLEHEASAVPELVGEIARRCQAIIAVALVGTEGGARQQAEAERIGTVLSG